MQAAYSLELYIQRTVDLCIYETHATSFKYFQIIYFIIRKHILEMIVDKT